MDGILLIDKPTGITSFDVVSKIKRKFNIKKVGHTGTLDPFASGLMIILCGKATKLAFLFDNLDKGYSGTLSFNTLFDTYDTTGKILDTKDLLIDEAKLNEAVLGFVGSYEQVPPSYSAIKVNGKRAYQMARSGLDVTLKARLVNIYSFKIINKIDLNHYTFDAYVSKGTYIRSLAYDLGIKLNTYGALSSLRRTKIGPYLISDSKEISDVMTADLISDTQLFAGVAKIELSDYLVGLVKNGIYLDQRQVTTDKPFIVTDSNGNYIAYYTLVSNKEYTYQPTYFF